MNRILVLSLVLLFSLPARAANKAEEVNIAVPKDQETCFSPDEPCDIKLWKFIQTAQKTLDVAIYDLTHPKIAHEIMVASKKIAVRVVADRRQAKGEHSLVPLLIKAGVPVRYGYQRGIMHDKFTVLDGKWIETGSYNYTNNASNKNQENQLYLNNPKIVEQYQKRFEKIWAEAKPPKTELSQR
jgi:phosphatidylserine/phosphatidylglycerophosphate/cardiolipin synthase-like enzyme